MELPDLEENEELDCLQYLSELMNDPVQFISNLLYIVDKEGKLVQLVPNEEQIEIINALETGNSIVVLKARQIGSSTIVAAYFFWKWYTSTEPTTLAILSHKLGSSKHLLKIHKTFYDNLPDWMKRPLSINNTTELSLADTKANLIAASGGGEGGLRSFTCSYLHISEFAFAPDPEELKATAISALNNGQLIIESTANYFNDALHQEVLRAERGEVNWLVLFFPWYSHKEYQETIPEDKTIDWSPELLALKDKYNLTFEQLYWYLNKASRLGKEKCLREYPASVAEAYAMTGNTYVTADDIEGIAPININPTGITHLLTLDPSDTYSIGVDVSAGVGKDWSVIQVLSKKTNTQAAVFRSNRISPTALAEVIATTGNYYNNAKVLVEANNYGHVVINELVKQYHYTNIWTDTDNKDWTTTAKSKAQLFEHLKKLIQSNYYYQLDNITLAELRALQVNDRGDVTIPRNFGAHGDNIVAFALASWCMKDCKLKDQPFVPNWIKDNKLNHIRKSAGINVSANRRY